MKLTYYVAPNFGDALNAYLLPRLFVNFFDEDESKLFIGIGSILEAPYPARAQKIVFGTGFAGGGYGRAPRIDASWRIHAVRGPRTAAALGIDRRLALGDGAILIRKFHQPGKAVTYPRSFMPSWGGARRGAWGPIAARLGLHLIDPRWPVEQVLEDIGATGVLIAEAMHGAIVADALRVPWIALAPVHPGSRAKWFDWAAALDVDLSPARLAPSTLAEAQGAGLGAPFTRWLRAGLRGLRADGLADRAFREAALRGLDKAARLEPGLSDDSAIDRAQDRLETAMAGLLREHSRS